MVTAVRSLGLQGISGYEVTVECFLSGGLPAFDIVGLGDTAVKESRERVRAAVKNCGVKFPVSRITVNLAPAGRKKEGTLYDLPILLGILALCGGDNAAPRQDAAFVGELSLTGALRPVNGVLPMAMAAARAGIKTLYVPAANAAEATLADGVTVYGVPRTSSSARAASDAVKRQLSPQPKLAGGADERDRAPDFCRRHGTGERQARAGDRRRGRTQYPAHRLARRGQVHAGAAAAVHSARHDATGSA